MVFERKTLITRRSEVRILPPLLPMDKGLATSRVPFSLPVFGPVYTKLYTSLTGNMVR